MHVLYRYSSGFDGNVVLNASAVVEHGSFLFRSFIFRMKFPLALHIEIYTASHGFLAIAWLLSADVAGLFKHYVVLQCE